MKIEKINENQILWSVYREDLVRNEVSLADFLAGTPKVLELFQEAIRQAEREFSFRVDGYMLNCQLKELNDEKISFTITKKEAFPDDFCLIGEFNTLDEVIGIAGLLSRRMDLKNSLYKMEDSYLLIMQPRKKDEKQIAWCSMRLSEYIRVEAINKSQRAFIEEHGECIIPNQALQKLRNMVFGRDETEHILMEVGEAAHKWVEEPVELVTG